MHPPEPIAPPSPLLLALEGRAWLELAALVPALPALTSAPSGDGHPVLVLPGFLADDASTRAMRWFLRDRGYHAHAWRLGRNRGPTPETVAGLVARLEALHQRHGRTVSIVGWSLGGIYARELARRFPEKVRLVITLATPFRDPLATNVARFSRLGIGLRPANGPTVPRERLRAPLPVPATSFYSETDGIVAWQSCLDDESPRAENLAVRSSHCGMGHHPTVLLAIADRLAQAEGSWRPFQPRPSSWWPFAPSVAPTPE
ncbi:MAG: esterase/lipase family protein [Candidatus Binatia bacterium]